MAVSKAAAVLMVVALVACLAALEAQQIVDCGAACAARCGESSRPRLCERACGTCCERCNCVPPVTAGDGQDLCACYFNQTTHGGRRKCP